MSTALCAPPIAPTRTRRRGIGIGIGIVVAASLLVLGGCDLKKKFEERAARALAERMIEGAAGGEVDVDLSTDKIVIRDKEGKQVISADARAGTLVVTEDGKTVTARADQATGETTIESSDGSKIVAGQKLPEGLPIDLPPAAKVELGSRNKLPEDKGVGWMVIMVAEASDIGATATHFQSQLEAKGLEVSRTDISAGQQAVILSGKDADGKRSGSVNMTKLPDDASDFPGKVMVQLVYQDSDAR